MSRRKRKGSNSGQFSAGDPPIPAPHANASGTASGAQGITPPPGDISRNGWIILGVIIVGVVAALYYFTRDDSGLLPGGSNGDPSDPANPRVVMETSMGVIKIELYQKRAPKTVENFLKYVNAKHFDGTIFHRVVQGFMIQGGGFEPGMVERGSKFSPVRNEAGNGLSNEAGTIAMARLDDPDSATDQFFINVADNRKGLDRKAGSAGYTVFGKVISGMEVANEIQFVRVGNRAGHKNVPVEDVIIKSIRREQPK